MPAPSPASSRPWSRRAEGLAVVGFWLTLGILSALREASQGGGGGPVEWGEIVETFAEVGIWALLTPLVFWVALRYPLGKEAWAKRFVAQIALGVAIAFLVEYLTRGVLRPLLSGPLPAHRAWSISDTFTRLRLLDEFIIYVATLAAGYARATLFQLRDRQLEADRLIADRARLEAQLAEAHLAALRMQLNPHFLFNTLNAVSALVERDPAGVRTMIARLSSLLRRVLDTDGALLAPLRDEVAFLRDYLDVQRIRFQDRLQVEEAWASETLDALVPPLVLQPLVENAIGHGVSRIEDGIGVVRLSAHRDGRQLVLTVEDNGPGPGPAQTERPGGLGLPNTKARLEALYGDAASVKLTPASSGGTLATVSLPFQTTPEARVAPLGHA